LAIPLLDLKVLFEAQESEIRRAIDRVLASQHFIMGPEVSALESEIAAFLGDTVECVACSSGSAALLLAMMALDIGPGDEVLVPTYSFYSTASCVTRVGATPVWIDIEPDSLNIDPDKVGAALTDRTKAIIPVHLYGRPADLDGIKAALARAGREEHVTIVEDAAQALSARYKGRQVGTFGKLTCLSFFPSKNLGAFGDAGMVVSTEPELAQRVAILAKHGAEPKYLHHVTGINSRLDALQAAILRVKLPLLDTWSDARRQNADRYRALFGTAGLEEFVVLPPDDGADEAYRSVYNQFCLQVERRDELVEALKRAGIGSAIYYPLPLHLQPCFAGLGGREGDHPVCERAASRSIAIPVYPGLSEEQQVAVVETIRDFYHAAS
jgi:dTDP-4-amino-4,6-dideoxygalactose transaminase